MTSYSLSWLVREREELVKDRNAFASCLDIMKKRIIESNEIDLPRTPVLQHWSGTRAVVGSLEMALHSVERTIEEMDKIILSIRNGEIMDDDKDLGGNN